MTAFARAIRDGAAYPVPIADVLHGMAVFDAIVESERAAKSCRERESVGNNTASDNMDSGGPVRRGMQSRRRPVAACGTKVFMLSL